MAAWNESVTARRGGWLSHVRTEDRITLTGERIERRAGELAARSDQEVTKAIRDGTPLKKRSPSAAPGVINETDDEDAGAQVEVSQDGTQAAG
jgi:hypothetical protein